MYGKILVPLDGSELAECVLPYVESIAKGCSVETVMFVRVVEPVHMPISVASRRISIDSPTILTAPQSIMSPITRATMVSAIYHPVNRIIMPAMMTPTEDIVSPTICQKAALIFRLRRLA